MLPEYHLPVRQAEAGRVEHEIVGVERCRAAVAEGGGSQRMSAGVAQTAPRCLGGGVVGAGPLEFVEDVRQASTGPGGNRTDRLGEDDALEVRRGRSRQEREEAGGDQGAFRAREDPERVEAEARP